MTVELTDQDLIGATYTLALHRHLYPVLSRKEADARTALAAAIQKMDAAEGVPGRHNLQEQAAVNTAITGYAEAIADLVRGET